MAETLLPCPLCGSTNLKQYVTNARERNRRVIVCKGCGLRLEAYSDEERTVAQAYQGDFKSAHEFMWEQARKAVADKWNRRSERTCHMVDNGCELCCSECDCRHDYDDEPNYCHNCGARVVSA